MVDSQRECRGSAECDEVVFAVLLDIDGHIIHGELTLRPIDDSLFLLFLHLTNQFIEQTAGFFLIHRRHLLEGCFTELVQTLSALRGSFWVVGVTQWTLHGRADLGLTPILEAVEYHVYTSSVVSLRPPSPYNPHSPL